MDKRIQFRQQDLKNFIDMLDFYAQKCDDLSEDKDLRASAENCLSSAVNAAMDIAEWILREETGTEEKKHKATILHLGDISVLDRDFSQVLSKSSEFWDRVLYKRNSIDVNETCDYLKDNLDDFKRFADALGDYLKGR